MVRECKEVKNMQGDMMKSIKVRLCIQGIPWKEEMRDYDVINNDIHYNLGIEIDGLPKQIAPLFTLMDMTFIYKDTLMEGKLNDSHFVAMYELESIKYPEYEALKVTEYEYHRLLDKFDEVYVTFTMLQKSYDELKALENAERIKLDLYRRKFSELRDKHTTLRYKLQRIRNHRKKVKDGKKKIKGVRS